MCILGAYCLTGTTSPYENECPAGTYNNRTLADNAFDCLPCTRQYLTYILRTIHCLGGGGGEFFFKNIFAKKSLNPLQLFL